MNDIRFKCPICGKEHKLKKGFKSKICEGKVPIRKKEPEKFRGNCLYKIFERVIK